METMFSDTFRSHSLSDMADRSDWIAIRTCPWCVCGNTHSGGKWNSQPVENKFYFVALQSDWGSTERGEGGDVADCVARECDREREMRRDEVEEKRRIGGLAPAARRWATRVSILWRNFLATRLNATTSLCTFFRILFCSPPPPPLAKLFLPPDSSEV